MFKAASATAECLRKAPFVSDRVNTPFHTRFGDSLYEFYAKDPEKGERFARAMAGVVKCELIPVPCFSKREEMFDAGHTVDRQVDEVQEHYPWSAYGHAIVVDVGGGNGHVSMSLAKVSGLLAEDFRRRMNNTNECTEISAS